MELNKQSEKKQEEDRKFEEKVEKLEDEAMRVSPEEEMAQLLEKVSDLEPSDVYSQKSWEELWPC
ncbi:hypothetical protein AGMMS50296_4960 [Alphaproteobacteria bacterium]|nr:hypothetical protein AGMMS50296_4960 [Alphaproteobacteria bacterium]